METHEILIVKPAQERGSKLLEAELTQKSKIELSNEDLGFAAGGPSVVNMP